jgi:hypothetical protein
MARRPRQVGPLTHKQFTMQMVAVAIAKATWKRAETTEGVRLRIHDCASPVTVADVAGDKFWTSSDMPLLGRTWRLRLYKFRQPGPNGK